jgi:tetratricopeptide (TPR) repeat protein
MRYESDDLHEELNLDDWDSEQWEQYFTDPNESEYDGEIETIDEDIFLEEHDETYPLTDDDLTRSESSNPKKQKAIEIEEEFWRNKYPVVAVKAAAKWRHEGNPKQAIRFIKALEKDNFHKFSEPRVRASLLTTYGASLNQIYSHQKALEVAQKAIDLSKNGHHAYRVAGHAARKLGRHEEADVFFNIADSNEKKHNQNE